jgi:hypothetical protein
MISLRGWISRPGARSVRIAFSCRLRGNAAEPCDQGFLVSVADADGLGAGARPVRGLDGGLVAGRHLGHRRAVPGRERLRQRGFHDPPQPFHPVDVSGEQVVLDDAPVPGPVGRDDVVVAEVVQGGLRGGFAAGQVGRAFGFDHRDGPAQRYAAVDSLPAAGAAVLGGDLVSGESGRAGARVRDQGFLV